MGRGWPQCVEYLQVQDELPHVPADMIFLSQNWELSQLSLTGGQVEGHSVGHERTQRAYTVWRAWE